MDDVAGFETFSMYGPSPVAAGPHSLQTNVHHVFATGGRTSSCGWKCERWTSTVCYSYQLAAGIRAEALPDEARMVGFVHPYKLPGTRA